MMTVLIYVLAISFLLVVLIASHELGHYLAARSVGIRVERFYIGFNLFGLGIKKKIGDTEYGLGLIPLGGYVKVAGIVDESMDTKLTGAEWEFQSKNTWQKIWFISAGVLVNLLLAVVIFGGLTLVHGIPVSDPRPLVGSLVPDFPAQAAGVQKEDQIIALDQIPVSSWEEVISVIHARPNQSIDVTLMRGDDTLRQTISTRPVVVGARQGDEITTINDVPVSSWKELDSLIHNQPEETFEVTWIRNGETVYTTLGVHLGGAPPPGDLRIVGMIGIGQKVNPLISLLHNRPVDSRPAGIGEAMRAGFSLTWRWLAFIGRFLVMIITRQANLSDVGGPIMIAQLAGQSAKIGFSYLLGILAIISVNLAFINMLPIPALDGGHIAIVLVEAAIRRPLSLRVRMAIQQLGVVLLLTLIVVIFYNDIMRIVR